MSGLAGHARSGQGSTSVSKALKARGEVVKNAGPGSSDETTTPCETESSPMKSLAAHARSGNVDLSKMIVKPESQGNVPSNIPGAGPQGVPPAEADEMGAFARRGNADMIPTVVNAQTGLATHGPAVVSAVARMGGQVRLAPGQFRAWAHPRENVPAPQSEQTKPATPAPAVY